MTNRLSYTAASTFKECGKKYEYKYVQNLRERVTGSPLIFGSALDNALNSLLMGKDTYKADFENALTNPEINKVKVFLPGSLLVRYSQSDFDLEILPEEDIKFLEEKATELLGKSEGLSLDYGECLESKKNKSATEEELKFISHCCFLSLKQKGILMLEAYKEKIIPRIKEVIDVQRWIKIKNDEGDSIIGVVDLLCKWEDGSVIIFDNKTSSVAYAKDSVEVSEQLGLYCYALENFFNTRKAGYIVMGKEINKNKVKTCSLCGNIGEGRYTTCNNRVEDKRCGGSFIVTKNPKAEIEIIIQDIPKKQDDLIINAYEEVNQKIKAKEFGKNPASCKGKFGPCEYFNICWNNDDSGLTRV